MTLPFLIRLRYAWAVLRGTLFLPAQLVELNLMTDLTKTAAAIAALSESADRLIALNQSNAASLATAQADLANADETISQQVAAIGAKIDAVAPAPVFDTAAPVAG